MLHTGLLWGYRGGAGLLDPWEGYWSRGKGVNPLMKYSYISKFHLQIIDGALLDIGSPLLAANRTFKCPCLAPDTKGSKSLQLFLQTLITQPFWPFIKDYPCELWWNTCSWCMEFTRTWNCFFLCCSLASNSSSSCFSRSSWSLTSEMFLPESSLEGNACNTNITGKKISLVKFPRGHFLNIFAESRFAKKNQETRETGIMILFLPGWFWPLNRTPFGFAWPTLPAPNHFWPR